MSYDPPEPCMCGAEDCRRCRPLTWREALYDEDQGYDPDDPKHPTWAERQADRADYFRDRDRDDELNGDLR